MSEHSVQETVRRAWIARAEEQSTVSKRCSAQGDEEHAGKHRLSDDEDGGQPTKLHKLRADECKDETNRGPQLKESVVIEGLEPGSNRVPMIPPDSAPTDRDSLNLNKGDGKDIDDDIAVTLSSFCSTDSDSDIEIVSVKKLRQSPSEGQDARIVHRDERYDVPPTTRSKEEQIQRGSNPVPYASVKPPFQPIHNELYDGKKKLPGAITLSDILCVPNLERSYLFTFKCDLGFVYDNLNPANKTHVTVVVQQESLWGEGVAYRDATYHWDIVEVKMAPFTSHHSKLYINEFKDGSIKLWITSSNLTEEEFTMNNQMYWSSPLLKDKRPGGTPMTSFQTRLIQQLHNYRKPVFNSIAKKLRSLDFTSIVGEYIPSATASHTNSFGFLPLISSLEELNEIPTEHLQHRKLLYQSSSIASPYSHSKITHKAANIFTHGLAPLMLGACGTNPLGNMMFIKPGQDSLSDMLGRTNSELLVVFPTEDDVVNSKFGRQSGGWSVYNPSSEKGRDQDKILRPVFHRSVTRQRGCNPSHTKFIMMTSDNFQTLDWVLFTTHNMSKQAWGTPPNAKSKGLETTVSNYESGILISQRHYPGKKLVPVELGEDYSSLLEHEVPIILPFKVPPPKYSDTDKPWCIFG